MTATKTPSPVLDVRDLVVSFATPEGMVQAVRGVSFSVDRGRTLAIVGESGSGKSAAMLALLGLTAGALVTGHATLDEQELLRLPERELRALRGAAISMVFQNPHTSLHPSFTIGWQIGEVMRIHGTASKRAARARAVELLDQVGIDRAAQRVDDYPHQFSGGMLQRAMIAMAIALTPRLLIADEPTTALDATIQSQILELLRRLQREMGMAMVFITHDLGVVSDIADDVVVMYAGRVMEQSPARVLLTRAHHPYTRGLLQSLPAARSRGTLLTPIPGQPPASIAPPRGCPFHPRCAFAQPRCTEDQPLYVIGGDDRHRSACWLPPATAQ